MGFLFHAPEVDLGAPSVNATTTITMPEGRWILGLRGPHLGPVVLFWSLLLVVLLTFGAIGYMRRTPLAPWQWFLLAIGLSQVHVVAAGFVVVWLHLLAWREQKNLDRMAFNLRQLAIVFTTVVSALVLLAAVHQGLLGHPEMQVRGNLSHAGELRWFTDRADAHLPIPVVITAPMFVYRLLMLAWALWLALSIVKWLRWGFSVFASGGFWRRKPPPLPPPMSPHRVSAPPQEPPPQGPAGPMGPWGPMSGPTGPPAPPA